MVLWQVRLEQDAKTLIKKFSKLIKEIPSNRIGEKRNCRISLFFVLDKASYINGALINISGGSILDYENHQMVF